jgi:hypothetical protein
MKQPGYGQWMAESDLVTPSGVRIAYSDE